MSETIWRATDADGRCWLYGEKPDWSEHQFYSQDGRVLEYYGTEKPPPGECWEIVQMRKGDIDTDGEPIGWKIVGIGKDGSVLCEKGNGQRRRYSFGDGAKEQPSGEAWERLLNVVGDYVRNVGIVGPRGEKIKEAWKAYEAAQSAEPIASHTEVSAADQVKIMEGMLEDVKAERDEALRELADERSISDQVIDERNATIAELRSELDETRTERHAYKSRLREFCQRLVDMVGAEGPEDVQGMLDKVNAELHRLKQNIDSMSANLADKEGFLNSAGDEIERLTKERDEARAEAVRWRRELDAAVEHHSRWTSAIIKALPEYARFSGDLLHGVLCAIEALKNELANEQARSGQVTTAQINVIAELQEQIRKLKAESATQTDAISERDDRIDQLSGELQLMTRQRDELQARLDKPEMPEVVRVDKASKTGWSVGDILRCRHHSGSWRVWRVYGVFLGAVNQESVIELECLDRNANSQGLACVPEDLLDLLTTHLRPLEG